MSSSLYFAKSYFDLPHELKNEIKRGGGVVVDDFGDCITYKNFNKRPLWAQFVGKNPEVVTFESIGDAAKTLLNVKKRWCSISFVEHRRAELIQEKVFRYKLPQIEFMSSIPDHDWGFWSLIEKNKMLVVASIDSPFPLGEMRFKETKEPPSRAYLKLWEAFTRFTIKLDASHNVVDLGACPGGWTWVLAQQGCQVKAIDKAPLDEMLHNFKNVNYLKKDAFKVGPQELGMPDWIFSDVICYPKELLDLVKKWMDLGVENFLCTLKFKGETDWAIIEEFMKIPNSQLVHLCANKHELTFLRRGKD